MSDETDINDDTFTGSTVASAESPITHSDEYVDASGRDTLREQLNSDIEAFLSLGGRIDEIPPNVVADPPKKPQSNYGGQPI